MPVAAIGILIGCSRGPGAPQYGCASLEDLFDWRSLGTLYTGGSHHPTYRLKEGVDAQKASQAICAYLRNAPGAPRARPYDWGGLLDDGAGSLHARDFWAMVLAELNGRQLAIPAGNGPHEDEIAALLESLPEP
jgi:hypothetical protein